MGEFRNQMEEFLMFRNNIFEDLKIYINKENGALRQILSDDIRKDIDSLKIKDLDINEIKLDLRNFVT
jgi:hypothetical protein